MTPQKRPARTLLPTVVLLFALLLLVTYLVIMQWRTDRPAETATTGAKPPRNAKGGPGADHVPASPSAVGTDEARSSLVTPAVLETGAGRPAGDVQPVFATGEGFTVDSGSASLPAAERAPIVIGPRNVQLRAIVPSFTPAPEYLVRGPATKSVPPGKWLEIEVEFEVSGADWIDELTFQYTLLLDGKLYPGVVTHVNIPRGEHHYSVMYVSPRSLERAVNGRMLNASLLGNIWVAVESQGQRLGAIALKPAETIPRKEEVPGALVPKSETPFAPLWWDRYEDVKPEAP